MGKSLKKKNKVEKTCNAGAKHPSDTMDLGDAKKRGTDGRMDLGREISYRDTKKKYSLSFIFDWLIKIYIYFKYKYILPDPKTGSPEKSTNKSFSFFVMLIV